MDGSEAAILADLRRDQYRGIAIASVEAAGWRPVIVPDREGRESRTFLAALQLGYRTIFEDDVLVAFGARRYVETTIPDGDGVFLLYCSSATGRGRPEGEWSEIGPADRFSGTLGVYFGGNAAQMAAEEWELPNDYEPSMESVILGWARDRGVPVWVHYPSLIVHVGIESVDPGRPYTKSRQCQKAWLMCPQVQ